jgi:asparagine synthase (glutamine-hydrolysing)
MCGITALFLNRPLDNGDIEKGALATNDLRHRGPDASGEWIDRESGVFLGHRRLAVIDLSEASNQPMVRDENVVSYNGEIYNYRSLRDRLRGLGHNFSTKGDTEVLMAAWRQFGPGAVDVVDGMFAFAFWDGNEGWLATDRFGEKPLFYATTPEGVAVASELPTLVRLIGASAAVSQENAAAFLSLGYIPGPGTVYPTIKRAPPATIFRISGGRIVQERRYWRAPFGEIGHGRIEPLSEKGLDRIQNALVESVSLRLEADAATCIYLSSGVDSSLVAAIAAGPLGRKLDAITVRFSSNDTYDESEDAARIATEIGLPSHEIIQNQYDPASANPAFIFRLIGQLTDDLSLSSSHQMAMVGAERGFKVGLTGLGGDEIAFGYNKHLFINDHRWLLNSPDWVRHGLGFLIGAFENVSAKSRTYRGVVNVREFERYLAIKNFPAIDALRQVPGFENWASQTFSPTGHRLEMEVPIFEFESVLAGHRLPSTDAGSMRAGMELRTPFLSRTLQETVAEFDPRAFLRFGQKSVLRRILKRFLPAHLVDRPKRGFVFPADRFEWMKSEHAPVTKALPGQLVDRIWACRDRPGWRALAVRVIMLSEFESWTPGTFAPAAPQSTRLANQQE